MKRQLACFVVFLFLFFDTRAVFAAELRITGTDLEVIKDGYTVSGRELIGTIIEIVDANEVSVKVRIDGVEADPVKNERWLYDLSVLDGFGVWQSFCEPGPDGLTLAFPIAGTTSSDGSFSLNDSEFTFSCTAGALAKCIRFGYLPWDVAEDGTPLLDHFRACTRMIRADYCGTGEPHTRDGTKVNLYDTLGIQHSEPSGELSFEAIWGPDGAICVNHTRVPELYDNSDLREECGSKLLYVGSDCRSEIADNHDGALIFNDSAGAN